MLSPEVHDCAARSVLCWLATVDAAGQPNVSPKEIFAVLDAEHLVIANIASPTSVRNIDGNPRVCVSFIDVFVQKGFKVSGEARNVRQQDADFSRWSAPLLALAGPRFPIHSVLVVRAGAVEPILAPSYRLYPSETSEQSQVASAMRAYGVQPLQNAEDPLQHLTIRARVAVAEQLGRMALSQLEGSHPGFTVAQQALELVASWQHHPTAGAAALLDALLDEREEGVFAWVNSRAPLPSDHAFNLVGGAVSLAAWHALRLAGEPIPEGFEEDEEVLLQWLVQEAARCAAIGPAGVAGVIATLSAEHRCVDGRTLGQPVVLRPHRGTGLPVR